MNEWLTLAEAAVRQRRSRQAVWRWITMGIDGIYLRGRCNGGTWETTGEALDQFCEQVASRKLGRRRPVAAAPSEADAELAAAGW